MDIPDSLKSLILLLYYLSPLFCFCIPYGFALALPLGIWGIVMLAHSGDPYPKPSPKERWFNIAKWYLIIVGILGTAVTIVGGVIYVFLLIIPFYIFYLFLPGPKTILLSNTSNISPVPGQNVRSSNHQTFQNTTRDEDYRYAGYDSRQDVSDNWKQGDDSKNDDQKSNYNADIADGWLIKHGSSDDDDK